MKRASILTLLACIACGAGLIDHDGIDLTSSPQLTCNGVMCVSPEHATGICVANTCDFTCNAGFFRCASQLACCPATALAAGGDTSCAVVDGTVQCWGSNESG